MNSNAEMHRILIFIGILSSFFTALTSRGQQPLPEGDLIIFHAGSLSVPFKEIAQAFMKEYSAVNVQLESAGSIASARKITDLHRACDILASADYTVIDNMLIPSYADWDIRFVSNEMAIVFNEKSTKADQISAVNWTDILLDPSVRFGRSDPNSDPCGYRTIMTVQLAEKYYHRPGLEQGLMMKDQRYIRPKEVDLIALLESQTIDYIFIYKSIARQHGLNYLSLPDEINLGNPKFDSLYATVSVAINGGKPGKKIVVRGESMTYGITILRDAPNREAAISFLEYLLDSGKGMKILSNNGQPSVIPMRTPGYDNVPESLTSFCKSE
ncbi:MAG: tungstate ABC transporter substrate-binding protein WtpA [Bacteroidales bacterium]|nr:tungstate ABC transporter substrate-binding protein WtpA [Bacteroidales bacterium]